MNTPVAGSGMNHYDVHQEFSTNMEATIPELSNDGVGGYHSSFHDGPSIVLQNQYSQNKNQES